MIAKIPLLYWLPAVLLLALQAGCAVNPVSGQSDFVLMSEQEELSLGRKENPNILKQYGKYSNAELQAYVEQVGQRLATHSHRPGLTYHFTLLDSTEVNAFALPGGYVYITRGLLAYLNSEAELAAVLGHEIGHVTARHSVRQYSAAMAANVGYTLGSIFVPELRNQGAQDLFNVLGGALLRGYGRDHELEADRLGAQYLARTGYDPQAMIGVIKVLKNQEEFEVQLAKEEHRDPHIYHGVFATHPDNDQRLQQVVGEADKLKDTKITRSNGHDEFLRRLEGLAYGPSAKDGAVRGNHFYHQELNIAVTFPDGWAINNLPDKLVAVTPQQDAALQLNVGDRDQKRTPEQFLQVQFKTDSLRDGHPIEHEGITGYTAIVAVSTSLGRRDARVAAIYSGEHAYLFVGFTKEAGALPRYDTHFQEVARSLRPLREDERKLAEPLHLHVMAFKGGMSFHNLAGKSPIQNHAEEQLRLLNDFYPKGEPAVGSLIKVVQ